VLLHYQHRVDKKAMNSQRQSKLKLYNIVLVEYQCCDVLMGWPFSSVNPAYRVYCNL